jgi:hypothetical protein
MVLLLAAGCSDADGAPTQDPSDVDNCADLAGIQMTVFQAAVDVYEGRDVDEMSDITGERFVDLLGPAADLGEEVQVRADALGCTDAEFSEYFCDHADELRAEGPAADVYLASVRQANNCP